MPSELDRLEPFRRGQNVEPKRYVLRSWITAVIRLQLLALQIVTPRRLVGPLFHAKRCRLTQMAISVSSADVLSGSETVSCIHAPIGL